MAPIGEGPHGVKLGPKQTDVVYALIDVLTAGIIAGSMSSDWLDEDKRTMRRLARKLQDHASYSGTYDLEDRVVRAYEQE